MSDTHQRGVQRARTLAGFIIPVICGYRFTTEKEHSSDGKQYKSCQQGVYGSDR